jgi:hypothetical protein
MKLKMTKEEFTALYRLLQHMVQKEVPPGIEITLLYSVLFSVYVKFYKKAIEEKKKYSVTLEDHEACAWWMFFDRFPIPEHMVFERNLLQTINNSIHQKFAV